MSHATPYRRMFWLAAPLVLAFAALAGWLGWLQLHEHQRFTALVSDSQQGRKLRPPRRGNILDARGTRLAVSVPVKTVCADPSVLGGNQLLVARTLAPLLGMKETELLPKLEPRRRMNAEHKLITNAYIVLKHKVPLEQWLQITQAMSGLYARVDEKKLKSRQRLALRALREKAVFGQDDYLRQYPNGALAGHVLGYVMTEERKGDHGFMFETHGSNGVERVFDKQLLGVAGWCKRGEEVAPYPGLDVVLTLDAGVQNIVEAELRQAMLKHRPASLSVIVVRPRTGEILALANYPAYDPNRFWDFPAFNLRNRALSDPAEPGSTFKVAVIAGALDARIVTLDDQFDCEHGRFVWAGRTLHDHAAYGMLPVRNILSKSSNIGAAKIGIQLGPQRLYRYITQFGFGSPTGILLPGESRGYLRSVARWEKLSISRIPMGHEILVTPLQMVLAVAALGNEGRLMRPLLVDRLQDENGRVVWKYKPEVACQVISPAAARAIVSAMKLVVSSEGTAPKAKLDYYTVAGKTGTAQKFVDGSYNSDRYFSSFIGFFPADNPELCISVALDEPEKKLGYYGGEVAAPVFRAIAERVANYLRLPPELQPEPRLKPRPDTAPDLLAAGSFAVHQDRAGLGRSNLRPPSD